jgi:dihydropteroate synthase
MRLTLGDTSYNLATRALVIGRLPVGAGPEVGKELVGDGANVVEVELASGSVARARAAVAELLASVGVPVAVTTADVDIALVAVEAGASLVRGPRACSGAAVVLEAAVDGDLVARREAVVRRAREAEEAGVATDRIVVDPGLGVAPHLLRLTRRLAELGYPVLLTSDGTAAIALAVTGGCRLVRTREVKAARRVCDVLAAILEARV